MNEFPKYLKEANERVFVLGKITKNGDALYFRVCGDWSVYVKRTDGVFTYVKFFKDDSPTVILAESTPEEFLADNTLDSIENHFDQIGSHFKNYELFKKIIFDAMEEVKTKNQK